MTTYDEIESEVRKLAHSLPPSDLGSTRAIQAITRYVFEKTAAGYSTRVGEAAAAYVRSKTLNGNDPLPATFRWEELFDVMQTAAKS